MISFSFKKKKSKKFSRHKNIPSSELQNFHFRWHMVLPHPSDTPGMLKHLGDPRECVIWHDSWRGKADRSLRTGIREGAGFFWNPGLPPHLSSKSTRMWHFICPGEDSITGRKVLLRAGMMEPPRQKASRTLNFSETDKTESVSALQSLRFSVTQHKLLLAL